MYSCKKRILSIVLTAIFLLSMIGSTAAIAESKLGKENVTITFWHSASQEAGTLLEKYVKEFNENNPYMITVNAIYQGQYSDATTLLKTILSAENYKELPDLMQMDATGKVSYFNSGKAYFIEQAIKDSGDTDIIKAYLPVTLENWKLNGVQLGLPFASSTSVTYYNKTLLEKAGWDKCPATFAEVNQLYKDMQDKGIAAKVLQNIPNTPTLANWIGQLGSDVVDMKNGSDGIATKLGCIENGSLSLFLKEWKSMFDSGALLNENSSMDTFIAGEVALAVNSSSNIAATTEKIGENFELGISGFLKVNESASDGATVSGSFIALFDSDDDLKKEASWVFAKYLTGADVQADFAANTGYLPSNFSSFDTQIYKEAKNKFPYYETVYQQLMSTPESMRSVTVGPSKDFYFGIIQCVSDMLEKNQTVEETLVIFEEELNALLDEYIRNNTK